MTGELRSHMLHSVAKKTKINSKKERSKITLAVIYKVQFLLSIVLPITYTYLWASLASQMIKNLPAMWETWIRTLGWEDPLEEGMATHSSIAA